MRSVIAVAIALVACSVPPPASATPTAAETLASAVQSPSAAAVGASASPSPSAPPASTATTQAKPTSAGAMPDAGILFISDYGPPDANRLESRTLYRYDGATGTVTSLGAGPFAVLGATGIAHDTEAGVYLRGIQGRWDLMHWDGTRASDQEFTACQVQPGYFASWCTVTPSGVGVGYGTHVGSPCGAPQFIRFPGDARGRPIPAELCVGSAWANDDGGTVVAAGFVAVGPGAAGCASDQFADPLSGQCYRRETWVITGGGTSVRKLQIAALPGSAGAYTISPDGRYAVAFHLGSLFLIDLATGAATHLGPSTSSPQWSKDGRVVFARGGGRESWTDRTVVVASIDGATREIHGYRFERTKPIGLAPVWDPSGKRLAWIASPTSAAVGTPEDPAADFLAGRGVGDRRVLVGDLAGDPLEVRCGEGVAEGVRWAHDGSALLLLCRRPGVRLNAFDLWYFPLGLPGGHIYPLVRGLTLGGVDPGGNAPSLLENTGWSRGLRITH